MIQIGQWAVMYWVISMALAQESSRFEVTGPTNMLPLNLTHMCIAAAPSGWPLHQLGTFSSLHSGYQAGLSKPVLKSESPVDITCDVAEGASACSRVGSRLYLLLMCSGTLHRFWRGIVADSDAWVHGCVHL